MLWKMVDAALSTFYLMSTISSLSEKKILYKKYVFIVSQ